MHEEAEIKAENITDQDEIDMREQNLNPVKVMSSGYEGPQMSSMLFGDIMVPNIEEDSILLLRYSILYKEYNLTGFNHQKNATQM